MRPKFGSPEYWLLHAKSDLSLCAIERCDDVLFETLCFHAQQCVEKCLKAVLLKHKIFFPPTHNVGQLVYIAKNSNIPWPEDLNESILLTDYAVAGRYPWNRDPVSAGEYEKALALAQNVFAWAGKMILEDEKDEDESGHP